MAQLIKELSLTVQPLFPEPCKGRKKDPTLQVTFQAAHLCYDTQDPPTHARDTMVRMIMKIVVINLF